MKSIRIMRPGEVALREENVPAPSRGEALIRMRRVGICGTDYNIYRGEFQDRVNFPLRPGHEWAGEIIALGPETVGYQLGDRVTGESGVSCGVCEFCVKGEKYKCKNTRAVGTVNAWDGAMCEEFLFPVRDLLRIPDNVSMDEAALVEPASNALMAVENAQIGVGSTVVIMGTGPIGLAAAAIAKLYGAATVISVGRSQFKLDMARDLGATHVIDTRSEDPVARVMEITGGSGADAALEISGSEALFRASLRAVHPHGKIVLVGFQEKPFEININDLIFPLLSLLTAGGGWGGYAPKVLELMGKGLLRLSPMITHRCLLQDVPSAIVNFKKHNAEKVKVMICDQL